MITDEAQAIQQVMQMITHQSVITTTGKNASINAETLCLHGDGNHAVSFAKMITDRLQQEGITIKAPTP